MKAYKGFNKDMTCRGFKFEEGKTYTTDEAKLCKSGFHACENPLECFGYYLPATSVYHEVELEDVSEERQNDSKVVGKTIKVGAELSVLGICKAHFEYVKSKTTSTQIGDNYTNLAGGYGSSLAGGDGSSLAGGYGSSLAGRGNAATGKNGAALLRGNGCKVKGGIGSVLVIVEEESNSYDIKEWKAAVVDGEKIKADTWYMLKDGEFVEAEDEAGKSI